MTLFVAGFVTIGILNSHNMVLWLLYKNHVTWLPGVGLQGHNLSDSKVHGANMGPTWVLSAPDGPHDGPLNLAISYQGLYETQVRPLRVSVHHRAAFQKYSRAVKLPTLSPLSSYTATTTPGFSTSGRFY